MTKRCSILQSKLHELESKLHEALLLHDHDDQRQSLSEDIKQKFGFIKSLLSAEIHSSSPPASTTPHHLQYVDWRIHVLEDAFLKWNNSRDFSGGEEFEVASPCSCTESCFNDDGGEAGGELCVAEFAEPENFPVGCEAMVEWKGEETETEECPEGFDSEEKKAMVKWEGGEEKKTQKLGSLKVYEDARDHFLEVEGPDHGGLVIRKELGNNGATLKSIEMTGQEETITRENSKTSREFGHVCGTTACGVVFGMVFMGFMMLRFSGCIHSVDQSYSPIPT